MPEYDKSLVWFRRDLRADDHAALYSALDQSRAVYCAFIFDKTILDDLLRQGISADRRLVFIRESLIELDQELRSRGGGLIVVHDHAVHAIPALAGALKLDAVFVNRDYEPAALQRDAEVETSLQGMNCRFVSCKDQVIFEKDEVLAQSGRPFSVFTPYKNAWLKTLQLGVAQGGSHEALAHFDTETRQDRLTPPPAPLSRMPDLAELGFSLPPDNPAPLPAGMSGARRLLEDFIPRMRDYGSARDFPAVKGPSYLSVHLRFGTISIRALVRQALQMMQSGEGGAGAATWLSELIWRDFYFMILHHHPHVVTRAFKPEYDAIQWESGRHAQHLFQAWCEGRTGYPLVDAAMLQLKQSGYMHNRLRMVTASFLTKDLGLDWRWGERYFAQQLNDYELSSNNGGWQWAASSGCDAQPYFRIFNPVTQSEKFDAAGKFIRRYLPCLQNLPDRYIHAPWLAPASELEAASLRLGQDYPHPIVQHDEARKRTLERYAVVKKPA